MKKAFCLLLILLLCAVVVLPALAANDGPVITLQPQNPNYPEYSVATYTVKATGSNLKATWYMEWNGKTYEISKTGGSRQAWEDYAGETYGAEKVDNNTFRFFFGGIEWQLNGATIWCVIEDGHYDVTSQKAYISIGNPADPPEILEIPAQITIEKGNKAKIKCVARSTDNTELGYIWYETTTGKLEDIQAMDRGTEIGDTLTCDTGKIGTRYYVCAVNTSAGAICYSSVIPVTVTEKQQTEPTTEATQPTEETTSAETTPAETTPAETTSAETAPVETAPAATTPAATASDSNGAGAPWWAILIIGLLAACLGVGVAVLLVKKKS